MNPNDATFDDAILDLGRFLAAIRRYLDRAVLCGGWVPWFYRRMSLGSYPDHGVLLTHDFDLALPQDLPTGGSTLHEDLVRGAMGY